MKNELALKQRIAELEKLLAQKDAQIAALEERWSLAQQKQFGKSAEGFAGQGELFNEVEEIVEEVEAEQQSISYTRKKPVRKPLPKDLPREQVIHDIIDKTCDCCGGELHRMGEDKSEKLEFIPAKIKVIEHIRPKYACRHCDKSSTQTQIKQASMPAMPINKGIATSSLLSQLITSKYQYGLPLYRQEAMFKQYGIELSRQTMSSWIDKSATLFAPLVERLKAELLRQPTLFADETPLKVVKSDKVNSYMWVYCSGRDSPDPNNPIPNIVLYDFHNSRAAACVVNYLDGYQGYLHVDGYQAYARTEATLIGCWAHARRKFIDAKKLQGKNKTGKADVVLSLIQKLYGVESRIKDKSVDDKYTARQEVSLPILSKLKIWLEQDQPNLVGNSKLIEAANYLVNQWHKLIRYVDDGRLSIDNNRAERAVKPFVIGRKNWLFSQTANGAHASATLYSIVETAKINGLIPFNYICACLDELCQPEPDIDSLLPWNFKT
ncbi:IS66 family transposase [Shewanella baltica]|uniref:Transposase and inactivated derivatives n=2 Tax=Shewanella TaxID=22 RepID=A0A380ASN2_9GAMM|nr:MULTISPECIES: IS66 family transposase [Shewanella]MCS6102358.1 IS66 family transposase [Shewanella baltica]MCS6135138.1 IS66 family transposase [Shewanella baltica]MCS6185548.1 IS66 family transposase [Shewanella baltica]SUI86837.1 Transposase and inactivated derivatives [Shewanella morhuae]SUJ07112.1 Transposase and inactivated derivatives [Shewanella morhuae]